MTAAQSTEALRREALCVEAQALIDAGESFNEAVRRLGEPGANLHRYLAAWRAGGFEALAPKQAGHSGAKSVRAKFVELLGEEAVRAVERRVAGLALDLSGAIAGGSRRLGDGLAWRTVARDPATPAPIREYFSQARRSKHTIASSIRTETRPGPLLDALHHGRRCYGLAGPWQPRTLDVLPGDVFSSDDSTPIHAWWIPWPRSAKCPFGAKVLQGQFLPAIDVASQKVLCFALIAREQGSYRASDVWRLLGRVHSLVGIPRLGWQLERGSWDAQIIQGVKTELEDGEPGHSERVGGLRMLPSNLLPWHVERIGAERAARWRTLKTFTSYLPKSKSVEGVFHRMQKTQGVLWGSLGRSQQRRPFERALKIYHACKAGSLDPRLHFLSGAELLSRLNACVEMHEAEEMEGEVFRGAPAETWARGIAEHGELLPEPVQGRYLMCRDWSLCKVARGMVRVRRTDEASDQPVSFFYSMPEFCGRLDARRVLCYFNRDSYRDPAHVLLPRTNGAHEYVGEAAYVERTGMFLDRDSAGHERRNEQAGLVATLYSDLASYLPSRQLPAEIAERRRSAPLTVETRYHIPTAVSAHRVEPSERISKTHPTGIPGVSFFRSKSNRRDGTAQEFLSVFTRTADGRRKCARFCISTLGHAEALRRAIEARGAYERHVRRGKTLQPACIAVQSGAI